MSTKLWAVPFAGDSSVWLEIESDDYIADPISEEFAIWGSRLLRHGTVTKVHAAHWLDPITDQLEALVGSPVELFGSASLRPFIAPADPVMIANALPEDLIDDLIELHKRSEFTKRSETAPEMVEIPPIEPWISSLPTMYYALALGQHFDLPVDKLNVFLLRYPPGTTQDWHIDNSPKAPESVNRTVSYSIQLSEPGVDYEGAGLETEAGVFESAGKGDLIGFTAKTPHRVTSLTKGERYALVCFASHD